MYPTDDVEGVLSRISQARHEAQREKRRRYFLKGPVRFGWILDNIPDPTSRVILVVRAFMDMDGSDECILGKKIWDCADVTNRYQRRRVLKRIREHCDDYRVVAVSYTHLTLPTILLV